MRTFWNILAKPIAHVAVATALGLLLWLPGSQGLSNGASAGSSKDALAEYASLILPILEEHCYECHGDGYDKGKLAFDALSAEEEIRSESVAARAQQHPSGADAA
jgi:hypothetical protein